METAVPGVASLALGHVGHRCSASPPAFSGVEIIPIPPWQPCLQKTVPGILSVFCLAPDVLSPILLLFTNNCSLDGAEF